MGKKKSNAGRPKNVVEDKTEKAPDNYMELREVGDLWKPRLCRMLNEQYRNGWKYVQTIKVGTDEQKTHCPPIYAIIFERIIGLSKTVVWGSNKKEIGESLKEKPVFSMD